MRVAVDTAYGRMHVLDNDDPRGVALVATGRAPDHDEIEMLAGLLKPGTLAVDAGANFGCFSLAFARAGAKVLAFEPQKTIADMLIASTLDGPSGVTVFPIALGASPGYLHLDFIGSYDERRDFGTVRALTGGEYSYVRRMPLDDLRLLRLDLFKIDVEGMEAEVLRGAAETVARCRPILYVEHDRSDAVALRAQIESVGYAVAPATERDWLCVPKETA